MYKVLQSVEDGETFFVYGVRENKRFENCGSCKMEYLLIFLYLSVLFRLHEFQVLIFQFSVVEFIVC